MMELTSRDAEAAIYQFYGAAAVRGMSVLRGSLIMSGSPRVLVITLTMWTKDPTRDFEDSVFASRSDDVFGLIPIAVWILLCVKPSVGGMMC